MSTLMAGAMSLVLFAAWRSFPASVRGIGHWSLGLVLLILASALFALNGKVAPIILLPLANSVLLWGGGLLLIGTQRFYGVRPDWRLFHLAWLLGLACMVRWLYLSADFPARVAAFSFLMMSLHVAMLLTIVRHGERHLSTWFFGLMILLQSASMLHRGLMALTDGGAGTDLSHGGPYHSLYLAMTNFMTLLLPVGFMAVATRRLQVVLEQRAHRDPLTQVLNRRGFADALDKEAASARPAALMAIDLDLFKAINDSHGHAMGDRVLVHVAGLIGATLRAGDHLARFGGEEFIVLLPDTQLEQAMLTARDIQQALRRPRTDGVPPCTASIGIACQPLLGKDADGLLRRADDALYRAKENGRDRIEIDGI